MKTRTLYRLLGLLVVPLFYFAILAGFKTGNTTETGSSAVSTEVSNSETPLTPVPGGRNFVNCIFNGGVWNTRPGDWIETHLNAGWYNELNFNTIHLYDYLKGDASGTPYYGWFRFPLADSHVTHTNGLLSLTGSKDLEILLERSKISMMCYAQRLVYEVSSGSNTVNNGFCYTSTNATTTTDSGRTVYYTGIPSMSYPNGYWLARNIYENLQHTDLYWFPPQYSDTGSWFMKPMMRIDSSIVDTDPEKPVVRIVVNSFIGDTIKSVVIKAKYFKDLNGNYGGQYKDIFNFDVDPFDLTVKGSKKTSGGLAYGMNQDDEWYPNWDTRCHVDFKIYWMGEVPVWFDKMTVDDKWANRMFNSEFNEDIQDEVLNFASHSALYSFFADECTYSNAPCIKYVDSVMKSYNPDANLHVAVTNYYNVIGLKDPSKFVYMYQQNTGLKSINPDVHPLTGPVPPLFNNSDSRLPAKWKSADYAEYNTALQTRSFGDRNSVTNKIYWNPANNNQPPPEGSLVYTIANTREDLNDYSPSVKMIAQPQIQMFAAFDSDNMLFSGGQREPTNEEIQAQAMISIAHGADGICWFWYNSETWNTGTDNPPSMRYNLDYTGDPADSFMVIGLINTKPDYSKRTENMYGQDKWNYVKDMNAKIERWKPTLDNITWSGGWSVHSEGSNHEFIENFVSIVPHLSGQNPCVTDGPGLGEFADCPEESYWEMGFFDAPANERNTIYFMLVNRRCVPENDTHFTPDNRFVKIKFNAASLPGSWKSWQISEVGGNTRPINFNKNSGYINLGTTAGSMGWFKPGEGKLFKITPTTQTGGDLVCDEVITGESFTCEDTIFNNGYNINIGAGTNMKFTDSSCIVMNGGVFTMGDQQVTGSQNITFDGESGNLWRGHSFTGTEIHIYGASFSGLANDSVYALNMVDCPVVDIRNTSFNTAGTLKGGINAVYYANEESFTVNFYIGGNTFTATGSTIPTINVSSFAGMTTPLIIENNTFTNGNTAIFLSGVIGGAIKNNNISENYTGISLLSSYIDISGNTISSTVNGSTGIFAAGGSEVKMNSAGSKEIGGLNNISNEGTGTNNMKVEGSYFLTDEGQNVFNISDVSTSYHLYGYFPQYIAIPYDETMNCFKVSGSPTNTPYNLVTDGYQGSQITFNFNPLLSGCDPEQGENMMVLDLGDGINDTIYSNGSGSGGSESSIENKNQKLVYVQNVNTAYDSICMLMRSRNYSAARTKCLEMIGNYSDSIQSLNAIAKLYLSSVSSNSNITDLKVFYEDLILNHPNNTSLVKRANYYILKCKVRLHEYTSALAGFQQIINENPYSYEGLIAKWDYMATSLLVPGSGGESSISDFGLEIADLKAEDLEAEDREGNPKSQVRNPSFWDDKSPFTKEERVNIRKTINTAIENDKNDNDRKIRVLETKSDQGDINAIKELAQVKALKQVVKTEKPRSITEHIKIVSEDIQKVFGNVTGGKGKDLSNIPTVYRLSQNYPNPFNPVTKINYDLPKDAKVNIVIYDILGREVKRLVNNELKTAGTYIIDFNASNYASGVYFYRIEAEESGGNKFVDSKKMVLLK